MLRRSLLCVAILLGALLTSSREARAGYPHGGADLGVLLLPIAPYACGLTVEHCPLRGELFVPVWRGDADAAHLGSVGLGTRWDLRLFENLFDRERRGFEIQDSLWGEGAFLGGVDASVAWSLGVGYEIYAGARFGSDALFVGGRARYAYAGVADAWLKVPSASLGARWEHRFRDGFRAIETAWLSPAQGGGGEILLCMPAPRVCPLVARGELGRARFGRAGEAERSTSVATFQVGLLLGEP